MTLAGRLAPLLFAVLHLDLWAQTPPDPERGLEVEESVSIPPISRVLVRSEKLAPGAKIWVRNRNGDIRVMGWDKEEMHLTAEIRDTDRRRVELAIRPKDGGWDVETLFQEPFWSFSWGVVLSPRCEMTLFVPKQVSGYFRTTNGSLHVTYVDGYARCETTNGDVRVSDATGEVHMATRNGTLEGRDLSARLRATTSNGQVLLANVLGGIFAETMNGNIEAHNLDGWGEGISLATTNGSIHVSLGDATGDVAAESAEGMLDIRLPAARMIETSKRHALLRVPGRTQKISLRTTNGTITVRE